MFCNECGGQNAEQAHFCFRCGQRIHFLAPQAEMPAVAPAAMTSLRVTSAQPQPIWIDPEIEHLRAWRPDLNGIGGWLLFFCVITTIVSPVLVVDHWKTTPLPLNVLRACTTVLWFLAGVQLWRRAHHALDTVKTMFYAYAGLGALFLGIDLWLWATGQYHSAGWVQGMGFRGLRMMVWAAAWFLYFKRSKRVKVTFGVRF